MNNLEQHRITKPNLTLAIVVTVVLIIIKILCNRYLIANVFPLSITSHVIDYLSMPITILTIVLFLLFGQYLDNFKIKNSKELVYLIVGILLLGMLVSIIDTILQFLQKPQGEGLLSLLDSFDRPYNELFNACYTMLYILQMIFFFVFGIVLLPSKNRDFVGGLKIVGVCLVLYSCYSIISYLLSPLILRSLTESNISFLDKVLGVIYLTGSIIYLSIIIGMGYIFYKANCYNKNRQTF